MEECKAKYDNTVIEKVVKSLCFTSIHILFYVILMNNMTQEFYEI